MKAIVYARYGPPDVLQLPEIPGRTPRDRKVLINVHASTVTPGDTVMRSLNLPVSGWQRFMGRLILGWRKPGRIEAIGRKVTGLKSGDPVFASTSPSVLAAMPNTNAFPKTE